MAGDVGRGRVDGGRFSLFAMWFYSARAGGGQDIGTPLIDW
jgi:hypothetical protein